MCLDCRFELSCVDHNQCVPAPAYEAMMELIEDIELLKIVKDRLGEI